ncbi:MAG: hypothetical protein Q9194_000015 [Teloschistes cf. exilis]
MSPDEKHELVEKLQALDHCCGFCGDGANDCGALKAADVGISLSEAEASVAAPFTSQVFDISCVPEVIREGRAALVTSFCCFKYMSLYSAIQFTSVSFLYASASNLGDLQASLGGTNSAASSHELMTVQYLFIDLFLILPIAIFRQILLCILIQSVAFTFVRQQDWFLSPVLDKERSNIENSENTALFLTSCFQYILSAIVLSVGPPFRQSMTNNTLLVKYGLRYVSSLDGRATNLTLVDWLLDGGYVPQSLIRYGIRKQLRDRIRIIESIDLEAAYDKKMRYVGALRTRPMAIETATANAQHYEVGTGVLQACLGPRMKYSCCLYPSGSETLGQAEMEMLDAYVDKAQLADGMSILDLGYVDAVQNIWTFVDFLRRCGWGSGALYFAELFPHSQITAFSNSRTQKKYIDQQASSKCLNNLNVITGDIVDYEFELGTFDRVVSIELFEHMKNYETLMAKVARALKPGGKLFVHIFSHKTTAYDFEEGWMSTHFFSGGTMPSADLLHYFQKDLTLAKQWWVSGKHYAKTCEVRAYPVCTKSRLKTLQDWLWKMSNNKTSIWPHLEATYGSDRASTWYQRWQIFYLACAELFAYEGGDTWGVSHYLFEKESV